MTDEPTGPRPRLLVRRADADVVFECWARETWIGAHRSCDLVLSGEGVAERHARLEWQGGRVFLFALEAEVRVGGIPRREWLLRDGDVLELGAVQVRFSLDAEAAPASSTEPASVPDAARRPVERGSLRRARREPEPAPRRAGARWVFLATFLVALVVLVAILAQRLSRPVEPHVSLDPYVVQAILPLESALGREPRAARLLQMRCEAFLARAPRSPSSERVRRALEAAEQSRGTTAPWTFEEVRFAVVELAAPETVDPRDVLRERIAILRSYLAMEGDEVRRTEAATWLEAQERALANAQPN